MTKEEIVGRVEEIRKVAGDDEVAHSMEDQLYYDFVDWAAENSHPAIQEMAIELRKVRDVNFARWHA